MKALYRILIAGTLGAASFAGTAAAQTVVTGTGNPDTDIAAVQDAVDQGGSVVLKGHFSFDLPPMRRGAMPALMSMILVSKEVTISGTADEHGKMTTIEGGEVPFAVEAHGATVRIERLRFVRPKLFAIFVDEVGGLAIESCVIENLQALLCPGLSSELTSGLGIYVSTVLGLPTLDRPGEPGKVSGKLAILNNHISDGGPADHGIGIMVVNVGTPEKPVEVDISGNTIRDTTLKGINVTQISGQARIERNIVTMGVVAAGRALGFSAGIHCGGSGSCLIGHNVIDVPDPNKAGIRVRSYPALGTAVDRATITDNDVTMSAPEGAVFGAGNAGIEIIGLVRNSVVQGNRVRGRARVGLSVAPDKTGKPAGNTFDRNDYKSFVPAVAGGSHQE